MSDTTILPQSVARNRPTIVNPIFNLAAVNEILQRIDVQIAILAQIRSAMKLSFDTDIPVDDDAVMAFQETEQRLRHEFDVLASLL